MHARHVTFRIRPGRVDDAIAIFEGSALPLLQQQEGFLGACMLVDSASPNGTIIILWDQARHSRRLESAGFYQQQIAKFAEVFVDAPQAALLDVAIWNFDGKKAQKPG